jgi:RNA polymerase sigma-32 factor
MMRYDLRPMAGRKGAARTRKRGAGSSGSAGGEERAAQAVDAEVIADDAGAGPDETEVEGEPDVEVLEPDALELEDVDAAELPPIELEPDGDAAEGDGDGLEVDGPKPRRKRTVAAKRDRETSGRSIARRDPLTAYIQEIRRVPLLTREEEHELAVKFAETGDPALARRLVTANLRLVVKIAHEYRRAYKNLLDLIQEGNVGLMQAVKKYDPYRGVKLSSYAAWWIRAYILKFILNNWRLVKIGTTQAQRKLFFNLRKEKEKLEKLGFEPEHRLLAERLDVSPEEVAEMERRLESSDMSLDAPVSRDDEGGRTRLDSMPSSSDVRPDVQVESGEFRELLREKLEIFAADLQGREATLFRERWLTDTPKTLQDIGDQFGISRERARQIEKRLLDRLRVYLEQELGTAVDIGASEQE